MSLLRTNQPTDLRRKVVTLLVKVVTPRDVDHLESEADVDLPSTRTKIAGLRPRLEPVLVHGVVLFLRSTGADDVVNPLDHVLDRDPDDLTQLLHAARHVHRATRGEPIADDDGLPVTDRAVNRHVQHEDVGLSDEPLEGRPSLRRSCLKLPALNIMADAYPRRTLHEDDRVLDEPRIQPKATKELILSPARLTVDNDDFDTILHMNLLP